MNTARVPVTHTQLAGLEVQMVDATPAAAAAGAPVVILLHGFSMTAGDLAPFGASMGLPALFLFPEGPIALTPASSSRAEQPGRAWWRIDVDARAAAISRGDERDLSAEFPAGLPAAHELLATLLDEVRARWPDRPLFLGGFSQGAILSLDLTLRRRPALAGLILLSAARVTAPLWAPLYANVGGLPIFQSHGRQDRELSFAVAQALADELRAGGAALTFTAFDGGHEIPLPILRGLKKFIAAAAAISR